MSRFRPPECQPARSWSTRRTRTTSPWTCPGRIIPDVAVGVYSMVIKVDSGPSPGPRGRLRARRQRLFGRSTFGSAGGTYYPSTFGHMRRCRDHRRRCRSLLGNSRLHPHSLHRYQRAVQLVRPGVDPLHADRFADHPTILLKPDLSAPDGNNTSFFGPNSPGQHNTRLSVPPRTSNLQQPALHDLRRSQHPNERLRLTPERHTAQ